MNQENLLNLATYLMMGKLKVEFDMGFYSEEDNEGETECKSAGCAIGHGPFALPHLPKSPSESWCKYSERVFGMKSTSPDWTWCFASEWRYTDNTPQGAAKRILYLLDMDVEKKDEFMRLFYLDFYSTYRSESYQKYIAIYNDHYKQQVN